MSAPIYQQINLYQPIFRRQRQVFSAATMLGIAGGVAVALLAVYAYGLWQVQSLEGEVAQLEQRRHVFARRIESLESSLGETRRREIEHEIERLDAELAAQRKLIDALRDRPLASTEGFSRYLTALARRHRDGLWLTDIAVDGHSGAIELSGRALSPDRVAAYMQDLSREQALHGQRFELMRIERSETDAGVEFRVSSPSSDDNASEPHARTAR